MAAVDFALQLRRQFADSIDPDFRMSTQQRSEYLTNPTRYGGMVVFDTEEDKLYYLNEALSEWLEVGSGSGGGGTMDSFAYADLKVLADGSQLVPGSFYTLSDFQTIHRIKHTSVIHTADVEPLTLLAVSENAFAVQVYSAQYPNDVLHFDFSNTLCEDGVTPRKGYITYRRDTVQNLSTHYDFRNTVFRWYKVFQDPYAAGTTYNIWDEVSYNGKVYIARKDGVTAAPGGSNYDWVSYIPEAHLSAQPQTYFGYLWTNLKGDPTDFTDYLTFNTSADFPYANYQNITVGKSSDGYQSNTIFVPVDTNPTIKNVTIADGNSDNIFYTSYCTDASFASGFQGNIFHYRLQGVNADRQFTRGVVGYLSNVGFNGKVDASVCVSISDTTFHDEVDENYLFGDWVRDAQFLGKVQYAMFWGRVANVVFLGETYSLEVDKDNGIYDALYRDGKPYNPLVVEGTPTQGAYPIYNSTTSTTEWGTAPVGAHTHAFSSITDTPSTLSGYGITDAVKSVNGTAPDASGNVTISVGSEGTFVKTVHNVTPDAQGNVDVIYGTPADGDVAFYNGSNAAWASADRLVSQAKLDEWGVYNPTGDIVLNDTVINALWKLDQKVAAIGTGGTTGDYLKMSGTEQSNVSRTNGGHIALNSTYSDSGGTFSGNLKAKGLDGATLTTFITDTDGDTAFTGVGNGWSRDAGTLKVNHLTGKLYASTTFGTGEVEVFGSKWGNKVEIRATNADGTSQGKLIVSETDVTFNGTSLLGGGTGTSVEWADILNKPATYPASTHSHSFASITSKPTTLSGYGITDSLVKTINNTAPDANGNFNITAGGSTAWADITGKPTTLSGYGITDAVKTVNGTAPDASGNVTISTGGGTASSVDWANVLNKPSTFAPAAHTHNTLIQHETVFKDAAVAPKTWGQDFKMDIVSVAAGSVNYPENYGKLISFGVRYATSDTGGFQLFAPGTSNAEPSYRVSNGSAWSAWRTMASQQWANTTFATKSHTHSDVVKTVNGVGPDSAGNVQVVTSGNGNFTYNKNTGDIAYSEVSGTVTLRTISYTNSTATHKAVRVNGITGVGGNSSSGAYYITLSRNNAALAANSASIHNGSYTNHEHLMVIDEVAAGATATYELKLMEVSGNVWYRNVGTTITLEVVGEAYAGYTPPTEGGGTGGGCLAAGTLITMADGTQKPVEQLQAGEEVASYDIAEIADDESREYMAAWRSGSLSLTPSTAVVESVHVIDTDAFYTFNDTLVSSATHTHLVFDGLNYRLKETQEVRVGESLVKQDGTLETITAISLEPRQGQVYLVNTEHLDVFVAGGYITHNNKLPDPTNP